MSPLLQKNVLNLLINCEIIRFQTGFWVALYNSVNLAFMTVSCMFIETIIFVVDVAVSDIEIDLK